MNNDKNDFFLHSNEVNHIAKTNALFCYFLPF